MLVLLALVCAAVTPAWSQTYPARPVKLVTQGAAGSGSDVVARLVTDQLSRMWDQQIVILNHPGAGGSAAARVAAAAAPDGYTLYVAATSTFIAMHEMFPNLPFSIDRDFTPIGLMGELPMMLAVSPSLGVKTLAELIALSKTRPVLYAGNARGTFANLTVERLRQETGADFSFVPYPGPAAALQDLLGGRISMMCEAPPVHSSAPFKRDRSSCWPSARRSGCRISPMCRRSLKPSRASPPWLGLRCWHRPERRSRSSARSTSTSITFSPCRRLPIGCTRSALMRGSCRRPRPPNSSAARSGSGSR
jgi:hypothetical protein